MLKSVIIIAIAFVLLIPIGTNIAFAQSDTITVQSQNNYGNTGSTSNQNNKISVTIDPINTQSIYGKFSYISGKLFNPDTNQGIANKKLIIKATSPSGSTIVPFAPISNYDGTFSTKLQFNEAGIWKIKVNFEGDSQYSPIYRDLTYQIMVSNEPSTSIPNNSFKKIETRIYLENIPQVKIGDEIVVKGRLFYQNNGLSIGVPHVSISIVDDLMPYYLPHQDPYIGITTTDQNGNFEVTWIVKENPTTITSQDSVWTPKAGFLGSDKFMKSYDGMGLKSFIVLKDNSLEDLTIDSDSDGIFDEFDACPEQPLTLNGVIGADGCLEVNSFTSDSDNDGIFDEEEEQKNEKEESKEQFCVLWWCW